MLPAFCHKGENMRKLISTFLIITTIFLLSACHLPQNEGLPSETSESLSESESEKETEEVYGSSSVDYSLDVYAFGTDTREGRVVIVSDNHYRSFGGIGGYTDGERQEMMIDTLIEHYNDPDTTYSCVIFNGDMTNQNDALLKGTGEEQELAFETLYRSRLTEAGIPSFCINASHDSLYEDEFYEIYGHSKNYAVLVGKTAYLCIDTYNGERDATMQTGMSDIPYDLMREYERFLAHGYVEQAFIVCHWPSSGSNFGRLLSNEKVLATVSGHTHNNEVISERNKPLLQTGHFSRAYTKMVTHGLGFSQFFPVSTEGNGLVTDEEGKQHKDYSATGSPWQYRVIEQSLDTIESYMVFPEISYKRCESDGLVFPAFTQPYTEARPSFLGSDAPIDKSYKIFILGERKK